MRTRKRCYGEEVSQSSSNIAYVDRSRLKQFDQQEVIPDDGFRHPSIDSPRYNNLLQTCFGPEMKAVKIPRHLGNKRNRGGQRSPGCSSNSSIARTVVQPIAPNLQTTVVQPIAPNPLTEMQVQRGRILAHLFCQHGARLNANMLTLFAKYLEENQLASQVFLQMENHEERLNFIERLDLSGYARIP